MSIGFAQKGKIRKANKEYHNFAYIKTSEILLEVANEGHKSVDLFEKLGNAFYFNNKMEDAVKWYGELMALEEDIDSEYYFRYAQALKYIENYKESDKWMEKFYSTKTDDSRGKAFRSSVDYLALIENASKDFEVKNLEFNSSVSDFGTTKFKNQLIYASAKGKGKNYEWNEQPFLDLMSVTKQEGDSAYANPENYDSTINTRYHESTAAFMSDGQMMFFTRNNYFNKKLESDSEDIVKLKIFRAILQEEGEWGEIEPVHFNNDEYSVAHPSINAKGDKLFFSSDMPGTEGESDLYMVDIYSTGKLGTPVNLGNVINTERRESFPFINEKGDLYFASDGHEGLGGLDIFVVKKFEEKYANSDTLVVVNVAKPINSPQDDFGYYESLSTREGFFTSNRPNGKGDDDIYGFDTLDRCEQKVEGIVKDKKTLEILPNATVILFDKEGNEVERLVAGEDATFTFTNLDCEKEYLIRGEKEDYIADEKRFTTPSTEQDLEIELLLDKDVKEITVGTDLADVLNIPTIYFSFDKSNIRRSAALQLEKVIAVLKKFPNMKIDVRSHTDSRASFEYNDALSNRRNKSTIDHLIKVGGIDPNRLTGKGYGERQLINECADGVPCSEGEHQLNRRSEFIVVSME
ncbi:OmpA family protein [Lacinutrix iliipiscaria]|uniref:OmpA family protein n=1 Tax=Lacinutrix iliipiscaria TaxID=1230532 RepID=A0ABW5WPF6_9FLAO